MHADAHPRSSRTRAQLEASLAERPIIAPVRLDAAFAHAAGHIERMTPPPPDFARERAFLLGEIVGVLVFATVLIVVAVL